MLTTRTETFYKVELTASQAADLEMFLLGLQDRHLDELGKMCHWNPNDAREVRETIYALRETIITRNGS